RQRRGPRGELTAPSRRADRVRVGRCAGLYGLVGAAVGVASVAFGAFAQVFQVAAEVEEPVVRLGGETRVVRADGDRREFGAGLTRAERERVAPAGLVPVPGLPVLGLLRGAGRPGLRSGPPGFRRRAGAAAGAWRDVGARVGVGAGGLRRLLGAAGRGPRGRGGGAGRAVRVAPGRGDAAAGE